MKKRSPKLPYIAAYVVSLLFVLSGAFNYGFSRFFMAIPFMALVLWLARKAFANRQVSLASVAFCLLSLVVNLTLERNPLVFPILNDGYVKVNQDGYLQIFSDGSSGFSQTNQGNSDCVGCGETTYKPLNKGDKYKVTGVAILHPDFSTTVDLMTEIGRFPEQDYKNNATVTLNKPVENEIIRSLGALMYYPIAVTMLPKLFDKTEAPANTP